MELAEERHASLGDLTGPTDVIVSGTTTTTTTATATTTLLTALLQLHASLVV